MKKIGILGGMSWESTLHYYRAINTLVKDRLGANHSAPCIINSVDFQSVLTYQQLGNWDKVYELLLPEMRKLERAGAEIMAIASNTIHILADRFESDCTSELIHIAESIGEKIRSDGGSRVGLIGTRFTMEKDFYTDRLRNQGLVSVLPSLEERRELDKIIFSQLVKGIVSDSSNEKIQKIIQNIVTGRDADSIILGCTELNVFQLPSAISGAQVYDSLFVHCEKIVQAAMEN